MYSLVLVLALTGGADATDCHRGGGGACGCAGFNQGWGGGCGGFYGGGGGCFGGGRGIHGAGYYGGGGVYYADQGGYYYGAPGMYYGNNYPNQTSYYPNNNQGGVVQPGQNQGERIGDPKKGEPQNVNTPTPGRILVTLPPNAKLSIDGYVSQQMTPERLLITPPIQPGSEFTYTLVADFNVNGQNVSRTQQVTVRPGQLMPVRFEASETVETGK